MRVQFLDVMPDAGEWRSSIATIAVAFRAPILSAPNVKNTSVSVETGRLLLIDDEESFSRILALQLESRGHQVTVVNSGFEALLTYATVAPDVVIVDLSMPKMDGIQVVTEIRKIDPAASVILVSGDVDVRTTVRALRAGAEDVQTKPLDLELLSAAVDRGIKHSQMLRVHRAATTQTRDPYGFLDDSPTMRRVLRQVEHFAQIATPVLVVGEPGTGKHVIAEMLHQLSPRATRPFTRIVGSGSVESALRETLRGRNEIAGGTLFVDGLGLISDASQTLLLSILTGDGTGIPAVRVIASTERDLADDVRAGRLRADVYQRLAALSLTIPSLKSRGEDVIRFVALRAMQAQRHSFGRGPLELSNAASVMLAALEWPGNVRQLRQVIEEAYILGLEAEAIEPIHLRQVLERIGLRSADDAPHERDLSLQQVERRHIARVLARTGGQRTEAARLLGITRTTLYKKMSDYGLERVGAEP